MHLRVHCSLGCRFAQSAEVIAKVQVAHAVGQTVLDEALALNQGAALTTVTDRDDGSRILLGSTGNALRLDYTALVDVAPRIAIPDSARQHRWSELPPDALPYLLPSRFCPSDKFQRFVARTFPPPLAGGARVGAILDWIHRNVDYTHGVSTAETTAEQTFVDRAGVCRDFTHLAITLCRAANIPARAVAAYAWQLEPQDFHAVIEVYLDGGWWLVDPTQLAPINGLIRIASGRDAADIAFLTTDTWTEITAMSVGVEREALAAAA